MDSKNTILLVTLCAATSLLGCQTVKNNQMLSGSDAGHQVKKMSWEKSGDLFLPTVNDNLKSNESRIVFFRDADDNEKPNNINIGIGLNKAFQSSLQNGHYSEQIVCNGFQVINASILKENGDVISSSENFQLMPQITTYLKVDISKNGRPLIQQISDDNAWSSLRQSTLQTHQISRVSSNCSLASQTLPSQALANQNLPKELVEKSTVNNLIDIKNPKQFNVLFDFDSANLKASNSTVLDGMANFLQSYPKNDIMLEGHTDNKGAESYNIELSQTRANMVKDILVDRYGMESKYLSAIGYGETMPIDTNNTEQGRKNNRRVVATVSQKAN